MKNKTLTNALTTAAWLGSVGFKKTENGFVLERNETCYSQKVEVLFLKEAKNEDPFENDEETIVTCDIYTSLSLKRSLDGGIQRVYTRNEDIPFTKEEIFYFMNLGK